MSEPDQELHNEYSRYQPEPAQEPISAITVKQPHLTRSRVVVKNSIYHQAPDQSPISFDYSFSKWLTSEEQPFLRYCKVGNTWKPIDFGWLEEVSLITVVNVAPTWTTNPTEEEKAAAAEKVIELGIIHSPLDARIVPFATIPVGEGMQISPKNIVNYRIRCSKGEARCSMLLLPA